MHSSDDTTFAERAAAEIDDLHRVLEAWFRNEGEADPDAVMVRFDESYRMVGAAGGVVTYEKMRAGLPAMRGSRPTLVMEIDEVQVLHVAGDCAVVSYREVQTQDSGVTTRWSTAVLLDRPDRPTPVWKVLQETFAA